MFGILPLANTRLQMFYSYYLLYSDFLQSGPVMFVLATWLLEIGRPRHAFLVALRSLSCSPTLGPGTIVAS